MGSRESGEIDRFDLEPGAQTVAAVEGLRELFPQVFADGRIDFDALRRSLGDWVDQDAERFGLSWPGKAMCARVIQDPSVGAILPTRSESVDWENTANSIIEGDNLEVLKLMQRAYHGAVKMIYVDPPYNTGKEFIYPDNFKEGLDEYLRYSGQTDEEGVILTANAETSGRYHSKWLSMMYPRLLLARNLLREDGVILVSIDDHEMHHLRSLMDEVFGPENFVATMVWQGGRRNDAKLVSSGHDYILIYARNHGSLTADNYHWEEAKVGLEPIYEAAEGISSEVEGDFDDAHQRLLRWFGELPDGHPSKEHSHYSFIDERGVYYKDNISSPNYRANLVYDFLGYQPPANGWRYERPTMERLHDEGRLHLPEDKKKRIAVKRYLHETGTWAPSSVFYRDRRGARKVVEDLLGVGAKGLFDFPKDHGVLGRLISTITGDDDLVLDFFAGSGSTAHAVLAENAKDGARRRFLLVQLPEPIEVENSEFENIAEITRARVSAAGREVASLGLDEPVDTGFRAFRLGPSNFRIWAPQAGEGDGTDAPTLFADGTATDSTTQGIVVELLMKAGFGLNEPVVERSAASNTVYSIGDGALLIVADGRLSLEAVEAMTEMEPSLILVLDRCFGDDDELKVNTMQTVRAANQDAGANITLKVV